MDKEKRKEIKQKIGELLDELFFDDQQVAHIERGDKVYMVWRNDVRDTTKG